MSLRDEFPVLATCVYLNSNSTGAMPRGARAVLDRYWDQVSHWRDEVWADWLSEMDGYVDALARFLGAPTGSVVTEVNLTTLLGRIGSCFDFRGERNRVVTTDLEFPTVPFLWRGFAQHGADVLVTGSGGPDYDIEALEAAIDERTLLVCVSHGSYRSGAVLDLARIIARAHEHGALVAVDAFQTVGILPVDVTALGADFVLGGAGKWLCGAHTAFLYVKPELVASLRPAATGWFAGDDPLSFRPSADWAPDAHRFAGGTPVPLTAMISRVGLDLLAGVGIEAIRAHSLRCTDRVLARADAAGIAVRSPRANRGGVVVLDLPEETKYRLAEREMICSWRDGLRIAPHIYNTLDEIDAFMDELT